MVQDENEVTIESIFYLLAFIVGAGVFFGTPVFMAYNLFVSPKKALIDVDRQVITGVIPPFWYKPASLSLSGGRIIFRTPSILSKEISEDLIAPGSIKNIKLERALLFYDVIIIDCDSWGSERRLYFYKDGTADIALEMISSKMPDKYSK